MCVRIHDLGNLNTYLRLQVYLFEKFEILLTDLSYVFASSTHFDMF